MTPIILTPKKLPILHSELTPKTGVTATLYFLQCKMRAQLPLQWQIRRDPVPSIVNLAMKATSAEQIAS